MTPHRFTALVALILVCWAVVGCHDLTRRTFDAGAREAGLIDQGPGADADAGPPDVRGWETPPPDVSPADLPPGTDAAGDMQQTDSAPPPPDSAPDKGPQCGNGNLDPGEPCDGALLGGKGCATLGFSGGSLKCTPACALDTSGCTQCGNNKVEPGEQCDGTSLAGKSCKSLGFTKGSLTCSKLCKLVTSGCSLCGNGKLETGELCDGKSFGGKTCKTLGYAAGTLACTKACSLDGSGCTKCGNGKIEGSEQCDGKDLGGKTCKSLGYPLGTLACSAKCALSSAGCRGVMDAAGIAVSKHPGADYTPRVAYGGGTYLVVWRRMNGSAGHIYGARVSAAGKVLGTPFAIDTSNSSTANLSVASDGKDFLVAWQATTWSQYLIRARRVSSAGVVLGAVFAPARDKGMGFLPAVAFDGAAYLVLWSYRLTLTYGSYDVHGMRVSKTGALLSTKDLIISAAANHQYYPSVGCGGSGCLAAWLDSRDGVYSIYGARLSSAGALLDPGGLKLVAGTSSSINTGPTTPTVAAGSAGYLVAWNKASGSSGMIHGARVSTGGKMLDSGVVLSAKQGTNFYPVASYASPRYLVVWEDYKGTSSKYFNITGAAMSAAGAVVPAAAGVKVAHHNANQRYPGLACGPTACLAVWYDYRSGNPDIYAARVKP